METQAKESHLSQILVPESKLLYRHNLATEDQEGKKQKNEATAAGQMQGTEAPNRTHHHENGGRGARYADRISG